MMRGMTLARCGPAGRGRASHGRASAVRILLSLVVAGWLAATTVLALPTGARAESGAFVATDVLNVRADAGTWATVVGELYQGDWVWIVAGPTADNWYQVSYGDQGGWVRGDYLSFDGPASLANNVGGYASGGVSYTAWVNTDALNVRGGASGSDPSVDQVTYGDALTVTGDSVGGWLPIAYWGSRYWVWSAYLDFNGPPAAANHWIDVNRSSGVVTLYNGDTVVAQFWGAMGWDQSNDGFYATANGTYYVYTKYRGLNWTDWGQVYIRDWVGFDPYRANGFHTYSMDANGTLLPGGDGPTGGCIAIDPGWAEVLYDFAPIGTRVEVHW